MSELNNEDGHIEGIDVPAERDDNRSKLSFNVTQDAEGMALETPSIKVVSPIEDYGRAGHSLIPLSGKKPLERAWPTAKPMTVAAAKARIAAGQNVGVRLRDTDLVIDVDPRNFDEGDDPCGRLKCDFLLPDAPFVRTGGGGLHLYFKKPVDVRVVNSLPTYRGIEFQSLGKQVVAAGSAHPDTAVRYTFDDDPLAMSLSEAPEVPAALLDAIRKPSGGVSTNEPGEVDPELLAWLLSLLDPADFRDHDKWLRLMMSCHHVTNGAGGDEFIDWSVSDAPYADHGPVIRRRWASLRVTPEGRKIGTLIAFLPKDRQREAIERIGRTEAEADFMDMPEIGPEDSVEAGVSEQWVWVADAYQFVKRTTGKKWRSDQWKSFYANLSDGDVLTAVWRNKLPVKKFESLVYLPDTGEFPDGEGGTRYNIWRRSGAEPRPGDVSIFLEHMAYLFPDEGDQKHVLDYLALLVQRPADKIHFALLIRGEQGTGKSWVGNLMEKIVGSRNTVRPSNDEVVSKWTAWMEGAQLAVIEELMALGRREVANRFKAAITDPTLRIEEKGCSIYSIPNCLNFLCFTNHENALPIEHGDRRWMVAFSPAEKKDQAYYERLFGYLDRGGPAFVKHWLSEREIALDPLGVAPVTVGKEEMRRSSIGDAESFLLERFESHQPPFDFDLVRLESLVETVPSQHRDHNLRARVTKFLKEELRAVSHQRYTKGDGNRPAVQLWSVRNHEKWENVGAAARIDEYLKYHPFEFVESFAPDIPRPKRRR